jgi:hypothetical protein
MSSPLLKIMNRNRDRQTKIEIINKAVNIYGIFFERSHRAKIPHPIYFFNKIRFIDIVKESTILLKFR